MPKETWPKGFGFTGDMVTITVDVGAIEAALACLDACSGDEREPLRYRTWYQLAAEQIRGSRDKRGPSPN